jgi:hypothetical protein
LEICPEISGLAVEIFGLATKISSLKITYTNYDFEASHNTMLLKILTLQLGRNL